MKCGKISYENGAKTKPHEEYNRIIEVHEGVYSLSRGLLFYRVESLFRMASLSFRFVAAV